MLNQKKVALMTQMALYEKNEGKKSMPMTKYYHSDYMSLKIINSTIVVTFAYACIVALAVLTHLEQFLDELVEMDLIAVAKNLGIAYAVVLVANAILTYLVYHFRFKWYRKGLNEYNKNLKKLYEITKKE